MSDAITDTLATAGVLDQDRPHCGAVDPDAIASLRRHAADRDATVEVTFAYGDRPVAVQVGRAIDVRVGRLVADETGRHRSSTAT